MRRSTAVAVVLSLIAGALVFVGLQRRAAADDAAPSQPLVMSPIAATLSLSRETDVFVGATIIAKVATLKPGQMNRVDLYDTGRLIDSALVPADATSAALQWVVLSPGQHLLEAYVTNTAGAQGFTPSKSVVVFKVEAAKRAEPRVAIRPGETVGSLRTRIQGTDALVLPPGNTALAPKPGTTTTAPVDAAIQPASAPAEPGSPADPASPPGQPGAPFQPAKLPGGTLSSIWGGWGAVKLSSLPPDLVLPQQPDAPIDPASLPKDPPAPDGKGDKAIPLDVPKPGAPITPPPLNPVLGSEVAQQPADPKPATTPPPAPSTLDTTVVSSDACGVRVTVKGAGGQKIVAGITSMSRPVPVKIGERSDDGELSLRLPVGKISLTIYAGIRKSAPMLFDVPLSCYATIEGNALLMDGLLLLPEIGGDIFVYLAANQDAHQRAPKVDQTTIKAGKAANIAPYLPMVIAAHKVKTLRLEVWRQKGNAAEKFAEATYTITSDVANPGDVFGQPNALTLEMSAGGPIGQEKWSTVVTGDTTAETKTLRWKDESRRVSMVIWQVLAAPLSQANTDLAPLGLLSAGGDGGKYQHTFLIPAKDLDLRPAAPFESLNPPSSTGPASDLGTPVEGMWKAAPSPGSVAAAIEGVKTGPVIAEGISPVTTKNGTSSLAPAELQQAMSKVAVGQFGRVYIRVLGVGTFNDGWQALGVASNLVAYDPPAKTIQPNGAYTFEKAMASVPWRPNTDYGSCVRVFTVNWKGDVGQYWWANEQLAKTYTPKQWSDGVAASKVYPKVGTYCPSDFGYEDTCGFWCQVKQLDDMFTHIWDEFAAFYNNLGATIGEWIAEHNPICTWAADASDSILVGPVCKAITKIAVEAIVKVLMSAVGLPPSVPTSAQLKAIAKAKLKELAKAGIEYVGVPCDDLQVTGTSAEYLDTYLKKGGFDVPTQKDPAGKKMFSACDIVVDMTYDKIEGEVRAAMNKTVVQQSGIPWFDDVPGFEMGPEPWAFVPPTTLWASIILDEKSTPLGYSKGGFTFLKVTSYSPYVASTTMIMQELGDHIQGAFETLKATDEWSQPAAIETFLTAKKGPTPATGYSDGKGRWFGLISLAAIKQDKVYYGERVWLELNATTEPVKGLPVKVEARFPGCHPGNPSGC